MTIKEERRELKRKGNVGQGRQNRKGEERVNKISIGRKTKRNE